MATTADGAMAAVAADIDGDGNSDVLVASGFDHTIAWYPQLQVAGTFGGMQVIDSTAYGARRVRAADLDGDGDLDVLSASHDDNTIAWYENQNGLGSFGLENTLSTTATGAADVQAVDIDRDGDLDVLAASTDDDTIAWYENGDGAGTFGAAQVISSTAEGARGVFAAGRGLVAAGVFPGRNGRVERGVARAWPLASCVDVERPTVKLILQRRIARCAHGKAAA